MGENSMMFYAWHQTMLLPLVQVMFEKMDLFQGDWLGTGEYYGRLLLATLVICVISALLNEIICRCKLGFIVGKNIKKSLTFSVLCCIVDGARARDKG